MDATCIRLQNEYIEFKMEDSGEPVDESKYGIVDKPPGKLPKVSTDL